MPNERTADEATGPASGHVCSVGFCPVAIMLTATQSMRPEVVEHLLAAGRELLLAMKTVIDARVDAFERESPIERITIE